MKDRQKRVRRFRLKKKRGIREEIVWPGRKEKHCGRFEAEGVGVKRQCGAPIGGGAEGTEGAR